MFTTIHLRKNLVLNFWIRTINFPVFSNIWILTKHGTFVVKWICSKIIPSMGCLYELGLIFRPTLWPALVILGSKFSINVTRKVDWSSLFRNFSGICRGSIFDVSKNAVWYGYLLPYFVFSYSKVFGYFGVLIDRRGLIHRSLPQIYWDSFSLLLQTVFSPGINVIF